MSGVPHPAIPTTTFPVTINADEIQSPATHACSQCRSEPIRSVSFLRDTVISPVICFRVDLCWGCWKQRPMVTCLTCEGQFPSDRCQCASCYTERGFIDIYEICHSCFFFHQMRYTDTDTLAFREDFTMMQD